MTSRFHGAKNLSSQQTRIPFKMATLSIASLLSFFLEEKKSIKKGENHFKSDHIEAFTYQQGVLRDFQRHGNVTSQLRTLCHEFASNTVCCNVVA